MLVIDPLELSDEPHAASSPEEIRMKANPAIPESVLICVSISFMSEPLAFATRLTPKNDQVCIVLLRFENKKYARYGFRRSKL